jgi:hypothetical protein
MNEVYEILSQIGVLLIALVFVLSAIGLKPLFKLVDANANTATLLFLKEQAKTLVADLAKNKAWESLSGPEKKQRAVLWLKALADNYGYKISEEFLGKVVEEAWVGVKKLIVSADAIINEPVE